MTNPIIYLTGPFICLSRFSGSRYCVLPIVALFLITYHAQAQQMRPVAISTRWARDVDPTNPLPEYPRPQLVRSQWLNLNGIWQICSGAAGDSVPAGKDLRGKIVVPFPVEAALSGVKAHYDRLWYRRTLVVPSGWSDKRVLLHFGAVDFESELFVNGKSVGIHRGGYDAFSFDITDFLTPSGSQELVLRVYDPTELGGQPRGKQTSNPTGILYTPTTGIWQTVWLEPVEKISIDNLKIVPDVDRGQLHLTVNSTARTNSLPVIVTVKDGDVVIGCIRGRADIELTIPIPNPKLWSPDHPFLYELEVTLNPDSNSSDAVTSYFGMRTIEIGKVDGFNRILLNHKPIFTIGTLDQGFWPDGIYTAPTDAALRSDIEMAKAFGFNTIRKHVKVEPARWYYWADKLGILVWQDMPSAVSYVNIQPIVRNLPLDKPEFESELRRLVQTHWNSPSIIAWVLFNEAQGQFDTGRLVGEVRSLDPSRLVNEASGNIITGAGDLNDVHSYPAPGIRRATKTQALVDGEFGGIWELIPGHTWQARSDSYISATTPDDLLYLYAEYMNQVKQYRDTNGLAGVIYTQLTDVEQEMNGLLTYDRIPKVEPAKIAQANRFELPPPQYIAVVPVSETSGQIWRYSTNAPAKNWNQTDFDDSTWSEKPGGFGNLPDKAETSWNTEGIWLRRHFNPGTLSAAQLENLVADVTHIGYIQIYINGVLALSQDKTSPYYEHPGLTRDARAAVKLNADNIMAVHCLRRGDRQWVDAGLYLRIPPDK
jgi:Glycosyl hydrolases family 2, sugar binding domain/Glycosyl hydrolases family 2/Glycosyl hydrolases family 2, TIM barrel domain